MATDSKSTMCKYHGPSCEHPESCLRHCPRKYEGDGHLENIDPQRLQAGHVLRMPYRSGAIGAYSDATITRIYVKSWKDSRDHLTYDTLAEALATATKEHCVLVKLSRPYLYANTIGLVANWLVGVETYEADGAHLAETHKVVVQSTGEYTRMGEAV